MQADEMVRDILADRSVFFAAWGTDAAGDTDHMGEPYRTLTSQGVKHVGSPMTYRPTANEAWALYRDSLDTFIGAARLVFFRRAPELCKSDDGFAVYSRLTVH